MYHLVIAQIEVKVPYLVNVSATSSTSSGLHICLYRYIVTKQ